MDVVKDNTFKHQSWIKHDQLAQALDTSGVYDAGYKGVNVKWQGKLYNIAVKEAKCPIFDKVEALYVRIMSDETCWIASFSLYRADYSDVTHNNSIKSSDFANVLKGAVQKNGPSVKHVGKEEDIVYFRYYIDRWAELIPLHKLLKCSYSEEFVNRFLELGLTADPKGVNVVNDSGTWNLSIHFSSQSLEPLICLKSGNRECAFIDRNFYYDHVK